MARDTIIAEWPVPPKGRLSFPMLILRMIANPVASWGEDFYGQPAVLYRWSRTNGPAREFQLHAINLDFLGSFERHFHSLGRSKLEWRFARKLAPLEGHRNLDGGIRRSAILEPLYGLHAQYQRRLLNGTFGRGSVKLENPTTVGSGAYDSALVMSLKVLLHLEVCDRHVGHARWRQVQSPRIGGM